MMKINWCKKQKLKKMQVAIGAAHEGN